MEFKTIKEGDFWYSRAYDSGKLLKEFRAKTEYDANALMNGEVFGEQFTLADWIWATIFCIIIVVLFCSVYLLIKHYN